MNKSFTLVEVLVVVAILALGWLWVPGLFRASAAGGSQQFFQHLQLAHTRAQAEAQARQVRVAIAVSGTGKELGVFIEGPAEPERLWSVALPGEVVFDAERSSSAGNAGVFTVFQQADGTPWRAWWLGAEGLPVAPRGELVFRYAGRVAQYSLTEQGALLEEEN